MYAVIRAGGKQYRVAPGDVIRVESVPAQDGTVEFSDVLAVSGEPGKIARPEGEARVVGSVMETGRGDKVLVFHYKRKKQYKKLRGHRQGYTAVRITEIAFDGQRFTAPELEKPAPKKARKPAEPVQEAAAEAAAETEAPKKAAAKKGTAKPAAKKAAAKKGGAKKKGPSRK
jgi:large subunit ribosomal protein L21